MRLNETKGVYTLPAFILALGVAGGTPHQNEGQRSQALVNCWPRVANRPQGPYDRIAATRPGVSGAEIFIASLCDGGSTLWLSIISRSGIIMSSLLATLKSGIKTSKADFYMSAKGTLWIWMPSELGGPHTIIERIDVKSGASLGVASIPFYVKGFAFSSDTIGYLLRETQHHRVANGNEIYRFEFVKPDQVQTTRCNFRIDDAFITDLLSLGTGQIAVVTEGNELVIFDLAHGLLSPQRRSLSDVAGGMTVVRLLEMDGSRLSLLLRDYNSGQYFIGEVRSDLSIGELVNVGFIPLLHNNICRSVLTYDSGARSWVVSNGASIHLLNGMRVYPWDRDSTSPSIISSSCGGFWGETYVFDQNNAMVYWYDLNMKCSEGLSIKNCGPIQPPFCMTGGARPGTVVVEGSDRKLSIYVDFRTRSVSSHFEPESSIVRAAKDGGMTILRGNELFLAQGKSVRGFQVGPVESTAVDMLEHPSGYISVLIFQTDALSEEITRVIYDYDRDGRVIRKVLLPRSIQGCRLVPSLECTAVCSVERNLYVLDSAARFLFTPESLGLKFAGGHSFTVMSRKVVRVFDEFEMKAYDISMNY